MPRFESVRLLFVGDIERWSLCE